tara:strand:+ start:344 stop:469 length:126 start_codon:yes stop_codon:yes gene_type:complete
LDKKYLIKIVGKKINIPSGLVKHNNIEKIIQLLKDLDVAEI